jgi:uncharacterized protein (DUF2062 family)/trans-aconitate methyltransferase
MHYALRTEGDSPGETAAAVFLGTSFGVLPIWGVHLVILTILARWLGVSRLKTYLAAHVNNPLTAPFLLWGGFSLGHRMFKGHWPGLSIAELRESSLSEIGVHLFAGSIVLGIVLGTIASSIAWFVRVRAPQSSLWKRLIDSASRPYLECGIFHWEFVRGKLGRDPLYRSLFQSGCLPRSGLLVDLGCGRGIVPAAIAAARALDREGHWDPSWPEPPHDLAITGVDSRGDVVRVAREAIGHAAQIDLAQLERYRPPPCEAILLFDVLHYLPASEQEALLERAIDALRPGGILVLREPDAERGLRFVLTRMAERLAALARRHWRQRFCYRGKSAWRALLERHGLEVVATPMWAGTPYGNVMIEARRPSAGGGRRAVARDVYAAGSSRGMETG